MRQSAPEPSKQPPQYPLNGKLRRASGATAECGAKTQENHGR